MILNPNAERDCAAWRKFREPSEGGLSLDPNDHGNWYFGELVGSNHGVTGAALAEWRGAPITARDMADLSLDEADDIAYAFYWQPVAGDFLPSGVNLVVADFALGSGIRASVRKLQVCVGFTSPHDIDGICGPQTLLACKGAGSNLIDALYASHAAYYASLGQPRFLKGWLARNDRRRDLAKTLAA